MGLFSKQYSARTMVPLCRQLATAYDAGIPIVRTLDIVGSQQRDKATRAVFNGMRASIQNGATLAEAARAHEDRLSPFFTAVLEAGERGGRLDVMLNDLAQYFEDRLDLQRQAKAMMAYPIVLLYIAWWLGNFSLRIVGQQFTGGINDLFAFLGEYLIWQAQAHAIFALLFATVVIVSRVGLLPFLFSRVALRLWPFGGIIRKFAVARFARSFSLLVASGVPMEKAIRGSAAVTGNAAIEQDLLQAIPPLREGATLAQAFARSRYLNPTAKEMLLVGEESGKLDTQLRKVSEYHEAEARYETQRLMKILPVLIMLAVFGLVGYVIISFYMRLYGGMFNELGI